MVETAANIARGTTGAMAAFAAGSALTVNQGIDSMTGVNIMGSTMLMNPIHSLAIGSTLGIFKKDRYAFQGAFGYKSLLRGLDGPRSYATLGGITLPLVQTGARMMMGAQWAQSSLMMHGLKDVTKYGLGNVISSTTMNLAGLAENAGIGANELADAFRTRIDFNGSSTRLSNVIKKSTSRAGFLSSIETQVDAYAAGISGGSKRNRIRQAKVHYGRTYDAVQLVEGKKMNKFLTWMSGKNMDEAMGALEHIKGKSGDSVGYMMNTSKLKGTAVLTKGTRLAAGFRTMAIMDIMALTGAAAMWAGGSMLEGASQAFAFGLDKAMQIQRLDFGTGQLAPAFAAPGAATERQRAARAIYSAKINPSQRAFGNEGRNMHR